jgi:hypothetical protein
MQPIPPRLGLWAERPLAVPHGVPAIREQGELVMHLQPLGWPALEPAARGLRGNRLDKAHALTGRDVCFVRPGAGQDTLPHDALKRPFLLVPVAPIPAVNPTGHGAIGDGKLAPVARAPRDARPLRVP